MPAQMLILLRTGLGCLWGRGSDFTSSLPETCVLHCNYLVSYFCLPLQKYTSWSPLQCHGRKAPTKHNHRASLFHMVALVLDQRITYCTCWLLQGRLSLNVPQLYLFLQCNSFIVLLHLLLKKNWNRSLLH
jgi:hypothetical protein